MVFVYYLIFSQTYNLKLLIYIFIFISFVGISQNTSESLIVVHYDEGGKAELKQNIYKYTFTNNVYAGREKLLTVVGRKNDKDYVRFDKGLNTIYKDRYLISSSGNIVDLKDKKVLHDGIAQLVRCSNDSIIFYTNDIFKGKFYSYYNIKTNKYAEIKSLTFKAIIGQDVEFDRTKSPYKLYYFPVDKPKVLLMEDAGHGGVSSTYKLGGIPIYWIDNNTFVFPNVKITNLEGAFVKYNLLTKTGKEIGVFNSTSNLSPNYKIQEEPSSKLLEFYFKDKLYLVNPIKETMLISNYKEIGNGYAIEVVEKPAGRSVYLKGKEIGKIHFGLTNIKSSPHYAAIVKEIVMGDESYQQGLSIYNTSSLKWENIDGEDVASLVGWINY